MALVNLINPDAAQQPDTPKYKNVVGIDLGTTNTLVATVTEDNTPFVISQQNEKIIPSIVHYATNSVKVGNQAVPSLADDPTNTITSVKRLMGRGYADIDPAFAFNLAKESSNDGMVMVQTRAGDKSPVEISAEILRVAITRAKQHFAGVEPEGAVVTVPAYFDDAQRQATKDAAALVGLPVLRLLNEPTAAALAYGLDQQTEGNYLVYDLGGGTFDISVLKMRQGVFEVLGSGGDSALGGDDYDLALIRTIAGEQYTPSSQDFQIARKAKEALSNTAKASCKFGNATEATITASQFAQATEHLTNRTVQIMQQCISDCKLEKDQLNGVILVGGSTRMPMIKQAISDILGVDIFDDINPDEVVACGAAAQADLLAGNRRGKDWLLLDVISLSLGIETMGGLVEKVIPRNSPIPIRRAQEFTTHKDGQTAMSIHVLQGERELASDCRSLARFALRELPPLPAGTARIRVIYQADADGLLTIEAIEQTTGKKVSVQLKPSYGLSEDQVASMLKAARENAKIDVAKRSLIQARSDAESLLTMLARSMDENSAELLEDKQAIEQSIAAVQTANKAKNADAIRAAVKHLNLTSEPFAQRCMQQAMHQALAGKNVDKLS